MRTCPHCLTETDAMVCPADGFATIASGAYVAPVHELREGYTLNDRYKIRHKVGAGGFGAVYKGLNLAMDQTVAIKVLKLEGGPDLAGQLQRFHREARAASKLHHPNTVRVFDFGQSSEGLVYMVMEFIQGESLLKAIRREGALTPERTIRISRQVMQSLGEAHATGIVHRDIKPENILLSHHMGVMDHVKVLDFGIAKMLTSDSGQTSLTGKGMLFGSPTYMSPEQATGKRVDHRTDVYSMGAVMYQMLTGRPPFQAETPVSLLYAQMHEQPPPLPATAGGKPIPSALASLVMRMLAKKPENRPMDAQAVLDALQAVGLGSPAAVAAVRGIPVGTVDPAPLAETPFAETPFAETPFAETPFAETIAVDGAGVDTARVAKARKKRWVWPAAGLAALALAAGLFLLLRPPGEVAKDGGTAGASLARGAVPARADGEARSDLPARVGRGKPREVPPKAAGGGSEEAARSIAEAAKPPATPEPAPALPAAPEPPTPVVKEPAASELAEPAPAEPKPTFVTITFVADRPATIEQGGKALGKTPLMLDLPVAETPAAFVFVPDDDKLEREERAVTPLHKQVVQVDFRRKTRPPAKLATGKPPKKPREEPPKKTGLKPTML